MSECYELYDLQNGRKFDLGTGPWSCLRGLSQMDRGAFAEHFLLLGKSADHLSLSQLRRLWDFLNASGWMFELLSDEDEVVVAGSDGWPYTDSFWANLEDLNRDAVV